MTSKVQVPGTQAQPESTIKNQQIFVHGKHVFQSLQIYVTNLKTLKIQEKYKSNSKK